MALDSQSFIAETSGWTISHRVSSALPGYLILGAKSSATDLSDLPEGALHELGPLLALTQTALRRELGAQRVYIGRYGHIRGLAFHFHIIPIYDWVEDLFWQDARYRALRQFAEREGETETDGAELTFFVWREFCERQHPPPIKGPTVSSVVEVLRRTVPQHLSAAGISHLQDLGS
ncbi:MULTISPECIES: hydrolase [unclassified Rhizobium]|jgi:diadenosine tetraphosphate (Ap4A) HIT family hydrolase|uniref:hydrolase n=1 Tax=unclassified Rhizobium TaxID=2613769 RepID=UPI00068CAB69|nr:MULTISPECIES: hydrolase [unclassified Rhizobium]OJY68214.1 MAG: HIT family protein [Rhizobium sp. 60-20]RKD35821.1 diadenosine tetraphosphate (Ap4A) HIT family hydrolase [Rhizobium sp. WW_1]